MSKTRLSNIELLRILSMFMIVLSHFAFHGFWRGGEERYEWVVNPLNHIVLNECYIGGVGVNLFVMISGYFLIGSQSVNIRKLFNLIGKVTFYSLLFYIVAIVFFDVNPNVKEIVNALLPWVYSYWFVGAYLILYVLHPYINIVINTISEKRLRFLCFLLLSIWGIPYTFLGTAFFGTEMTLFVTMYTIGAYFRKWGGGISKSNMLVALWCSITLWLCIPIVAEFVRNSIPVFSTHVTYFLSRQSFIAIFLSVSLFYYFAFILKCNENPIINKISQTTFAIYLITDNYYVRDFIYKILFQVQSYSESSFLLIYLIVFSFVTFLSASILDMLVSRLGNSLISKK